MLVCDKCGQNLVISKSVTKSEMNSTDVFCEQTLVCINKRCHIYAGEDLLNPLHVAKNISNKIG